MIRKATFYICLCTCLSSPAMPQVAMRECNLQAREIALRASEEVFTSLSADDRSRLVAIAEEVCMENPASNTAMDPVVAPEAAQPASEVLADSSESDREEESDIFNLRIIDAEDRVRRPGLKRR